MSTKIKEPSFFRKAVMFFVLTIFGYICVILTEIGILYQRHLLTRCPTEFEEIENLISLAVIAVIVFYYIFIKDGLSESGKYKDLLKEERKKNG